MTLLHKEACKAFRRDVLLDRFRIEAVASTGNGIRVDIGGQDLQFEAAPRLRNLLVQKHGKRISLFTGAAPCDPNTYGLIGSMIGNQIRNGLFRQEFEDFRIAEEAGDVDEQILGEQIKLGRVASQKCDIAILIVRSDCRHTHAPFDPALQCAVLVEREIVIGFRAQQFDDLRQPIFHDVLLRRNASRRRGFCPFAVFDEGCGNLFHGKHIVDGPRFYRIARHAVIARLTGILRNDEAALLLQGFQSETPIRSRSRQNHTDGPRAVFGRQRVQQEVERHARAVAFRGFGNL